jgi:hypothetical protein
MSDPSFVQGSCGRVRLHSELRALFVQHFVHQDERYRSAYPWVQRLRAWWAGLILPPRFLIARATASGWEHTSYDFVGSREEPVDGRQAQRALAEAVTRAPWLELLAGVLIVTWLAWLFVGFSPAQVIFKTVLLVGLGVAGWIAHRKWARLYIAYELDRESRGHLEAVRGALAVLDQSSRVWLFGPEGCASRLPTMRVRWKVRNVRTNLRLGGLTCRRESVYFLPDQVLVVAAGVARFVAYDRCAVTAAHLDYTEREGHAWADVVQVGRAWRKVRPDGSPDLSAPGNAELPVLRFGRLSLDLGGTRVELLTTNPEVPEQFQRSFFSGSGLLAAEARPDPPIFGRSRGGLTRLVGGALAAVGKVPARAWMMAAVVVLLLVGAGFAWRYAPAAAELYRSYQAEQERRQAEVAAQKRAAEEAERRQREEEEDFQRRAEEAWQRLQKEMEEKAAQEEARRREEERRKQAEEEARRLAAEEAERKREAIAKAEPRAAANVRYAQKLIDSGKLEQGIERLKEVVREFPETPSADKARQVLRELGIKER